MQPSRHNFHGAAIGQFDASTSDDLEHGLDWTRRGKPNARPTFLLWQKQLAEFSMPTTIKLRRTYYFLNIEMCASLRSKQSYTAHDITSRCRAWACCEPAVLRHVWTEGVHRLQRMLGSTAEVPVPHRCYRWAAVVCYPAACAKLLQPVACPAAGWSARHAAEAGVCLVGSWVCSCAGSDPAPVQRVGAGISSTRVAAHAHRLPTWKSAIESGSHFDANNTRSQLTGVLAREEGTKGRVGEQP